uniref:Ribosomal protein L20 n=1 Tax=Sebdenia flabellata TaxID=42024 RepID=A0A0E3DB01_9FLOR|nr:ribosomal protein L20 [Sebdenia flabellata]
MKNIIFSNRKLKKRNQLKQFAHQINLLNCFNYNLFTYFMRQKKIYLNRKVVAHIFLTESGTVFSLKKWLLFYIEAYNKTYLG